ncbi:hypothetical protein FAF44_49655 [Nonomuraea sp. MG754425]|uniref:hypothetical protein n=1 Tax=Nonomuraea sp. MG754425 TaxID=2570319 RepID=UPI001F201F3B|nr:hypothetical protein [Nonomuraea sp. MG754425]MCF6476355.1 hypothetical protein [Nonomuraea sp. MG754425]
MEDARIHLTRALLEGTGWVTRTRDFARTLRTAGRHAGDLLLVGTPTDEPWHMAAHLSDEARLAGLPELTPTLVRHHIPVGAPAHLAVGLNRLEAAGKGQTLFVVAPGASGEHVLERVADARRSGAVILAMEDGDRDLRDLAHDALTIGTGRTALRPDGLLIPETVAFETAQHLVSLAAGETPVTLGGRRGFRGQLARWLDAVSGPTEAEDDLVHS